MIRELQPDAVRREFDLFCQVALDDVLRTAVSSVAFEHLGLEENAMRCPPELRGRTVVINAELLDRSGVLEEMSDLTLEMDQFVRLRRFLERFTVAQIRAMRDSFEHKDES